MSKTYPGGCGVGKPPGSGRKWGVSKSCYCLRIDKPSPGKRVNTTVWLSKDWAPIPVFGLCVQRAINEYAPPGGVKRPYGLFPHCWLGAPRQFKAYASLGNPYTAYFPALSRLPIGAICHNLAANVD